MEEVDAALLRSRLHVRGGMQLLDHDRIVHAIGTLFDAVEYAMRWYYLCHFEERNDQVLYHEEVLGEFLTRQGVFTSGFSFQEYLQLMERSLENGFEQDIQSFDKEQYWKVTSEALTDLEVLPFDMDELPEENEETRDVLDLPD